MKIQLQEHTKTFFLKLPALVLGALVVFSFLILASAQIKVEESSAIYTGSKVPLAEKIEIPQVIVGTTTIADYSRIDLDTEIEIAPFQFAKLRSKEALERIEVPEKIRNIITLYDTTRNRLDNNFFILPHVREKEERHIDATFKYLLQKELVAEGFLPKDYLKREKRGEIYTAENILNLSGKKIKKYTPSAAADVSVTKTIEPNITFQKINKNDTKNSESVESAPLSARILHFFVSLKERVLSYVQTAIAWAQGVSPTEAATAFLLANQNQDGSWGTSTTQFIATIKTLETLHMLGMGTSTAATTSAAWINFSITDNNDYLAKKVKVLALAQEDVTDLADHLAASIDEETGGISFDRGFEGDPLTTANALKALTEVNYQDPGANPDISISAMIYYLANSQRFDGGWSAANTNASSVLATAEVLEALLPYRTQTITGGGDNVVVGEITAQAVSLLKNTQNTNGAWNNDLVATSRALTVLKKAGANPLHREEAITYIEDAQGGNGSFNNGNIYVTAVALEALVWGNSNAGEIVINDITATSTLQTGAPATLSVSVTNIGGQAVSQGILHVFVDDVHAFQFDIAPLGVTFEPNETILFNITFPNTYTLVGDVDFTLFFESGGEVAYTNGWYEETLHFNPAPNGLPGLPVYFQAFQGVYVNGSPSILFDWPEKQDPNRSTYEAMWREVGQSSWNIATVSSTTNIIAGVFAENVTYEVTFSTVSQNGQNKVYFQNPIRVTTSSAYTAYDGSVSGTLSDEGIPLSNTSIFAETITTTDAMGNFSLGNISNGSHIARVEQDEYDTFVTPFSVLPNQTTSNVKIYTRLTADTIAPTIDAFSLIPQSQDGVIRNKKEQLLSVGGQDNVALDFASFYYYNPTDSQWHFIATEPMDTQAVHYWYIPENFVGSGYKVKATVTDYRGNVSTESIYGPFTIVAGNKDPEFSFTEPNGSADIANNEFIIRWTDSDPDDNATISLYYDDDTNPNNGGSVLITDALQEDDPLNFYTWNTSSLSDGAQYQLRAVITDGNQFNNTITKYSHPIVIDHTPVIGLGLNTHSAVLDENFFSITDSQQEELDITGDLTIEAWYKSNGTTVPQALVSKWDGSSSGQRGYSFRLNQGHPTEKIRFAVSDNGIAATEVLWNIQLSANVWYHLAVTYDASAGTAELFINGLSQGALSGLHTSIKNNTTPFRIGAIESSAGVGELLEGSVDEVRVWSEVRTPQEIINNKDTHILSSEETLAGYWRFNGTPQDFSGNEDDLSPLPTNNLPAYSTSVPFTASGATIPTIQITEPDGAGDTTDSSYVITWTATDPDNDARINLYYDTNASGLDGTLIASNISENTTTSYVWNTTNVSEGNYYVYGVIGDGTGTTTAYSTSTVAIDHNGAPSITITEPNGTNDNANQSFRITWNASDPDDNALISVYYDTNNFGYDGTLIVGGLPENTATSTVWNTAQLPAKKYYIYAIISDPTHPPVKTYSAFPVKVSHGGK